MVHWLLGPTPHTRGGFPLNQKAFTRESSIANVAFVFISYSCVASVMDPKYEKVWVARSNYLDVSCPPSILEMILLIIFLDRTRLPKRGCWMGFRNKFLTEFCDQCHLVLAACH